MSDTATSTSTGGPKTLAAIVAVVVLGIYVYALVDSWGSTGEAAEAWARRLAILGGVEALAFAAAGWLFGRDVSRQTIEQANKRADEANKNATEAQGKAEKAQSDAVAAATVLASSRSNRDLERSQAGLVVDADEILKRYRVAGHSE